jgi:hypothetical protein
VTAHEAAMRGVLRRAAASPWAAELVLRGGLMMRLWSGPIVRPVDDVDFLALFPFDGAETAARLGKLLAVDAGDGLSYGEITWEVIWAETPWPGVRAVVPVEGAEPVQIDVGFADPLVPPAELIDYPGVTRLWACRPETMVGWKLHGLWERGPGKWRPKDLFDIYVMLLHAPLDWSVMAPAIRMAFESRPEPLTLTTRLAAGEFGQSDWSRRKWQKFSEARGGVPPLPEVVAMVSSVLGPTLRKLTEAV